MNNMAWFVFGGVCGGGVGLMLGIWIMGKIEADMDEERNL